MIVPFAVKAAQGDTLEYIWGGGPVRLFYTSILKVGELTDSIPLLYQMGLMYVINPPRQVLLILGNVSILFYGFDHITLR
jgi:hypothetical protein